MVTVTESFQWDETHHSWVCQVCPCCRRQRCEQSFGNAVHHEFGPDGVVAKGGDVQIYCTGLIYIIYIYIDCIHLYQTWSRCKLWFVSTELFESNFTRKGSLGWQTFVIVFAYHVQAMPQSPQRSELCQQTLSGESDMFKVFGSGLEVCKTPKMFKRFNLIH